jgi:trimethylamine--corrinoid protein Co-methyltransferase
MISPSIRFLTEQTIQRVIDEAIEALRDPGVELHSEQAIHLLAEAGAEVDKEAKIARIPRTMVEQALKTSPSAFTVHDLAGNPKLELGGENTYYYPGGTSIYFLDSDTRCMREAVSSDLQRFYKVAEMLPEIDAQTTAVISSDVPKEISDSYRVYLLLKHTRKPFATGGFSVEGQQVILDMIAAAVGGAQILAQKPVTVQAICPTPPLHWSDITCDSLILCAQRDVPVYFVSMPLVGGTGPATLIGSIVQHAAETLSGVVIAQLVRPGARMLWGGSPAILDMRTGMTPMGAIETLMFDCAYNEVGKYLKLPTHGYLGLTDAKVVDAQAGIESALGLALANLARVNLVAGAGQMLFESAQSCESLVVSHEAVGIARRLRRGINDSEPSLGLEMIRKVGHAGNFLATDHTRKWFRREQFIPRLLSRESLEAWQERGSKDMYERAREYVLELEEAYEPAVPESTIEAVTEVMSAAASKYGVDRLPA